VPAVFATDAATVRRVADRLRGYGPVATETFRPVCGARAGNGIRREGRTVTRSDESGPAASLAASLNVHVPHTARMYNYFIGGKDNFPADRWAAKKVLAVVPDLPIGARANRAFLLRAVAVLAGLGVDQFLDVGTGLPAEPNVHEVVQAVNPAARLVYVDNDPLVLVHARALLRGTPEGMVSYVDADMRDPDRIVRGAAETLDLCRPVGLSLGAVLHFVPDDEEAAGIVATLMGSLAAGSWLVLSHGTGDFRPKQAGNGVAVYQDSGIPVRVRSRAEVTALVPAGMEVASPGVVPVHRWRPDDTASPVANGKVGLYGLLARKL
jgi:hypothetical protein